MSLAEEELSRASPLKLEMAKWTAMCLMNTNYTYIAPNAFYTDKIEKKFVRARLQHSFKCWFQLLEALFAHSLTGSLLLASFENFCSHIHVFFQLLN